MRGPEDYKAFYVKRLRSAEGDEDLGGEQRFQLYSEWICPLERIKAQQQNGRDMKIVVQKGKRTATKSVDPVLGETHFQKRNPKLDGDASYPEPSPAGVISEGEKNVHLVSISSGESQCFPPSASGQGNGERERQKEGLSL